MNTSINPRSRRVCAIFLLAAAAAVPAVSAASWWGDTVRGSGAIRQQECPVTGFRGVALSLPAEVELRLGPTESVTIEADENILAHLETVVRGGVLHLRAADRVSLKPRKLRIVVQATRIEELSVSGGGSIRAAALRSQRLSLDVAGSGSIGLADLQAESVAASIGGSGGLAAAGAVRRLDVSIAGSGDVAMDMLRADDVSVSIAGSGDAKVWPVQSLRTSIAGSGDVRYRGDPKASQSRVAGSGEVRRLGDAPVAQSR